MKRITRLNAACTAMIVLGYTAVALVGCAGTPKPVSTTSFCDLAKPIYWSGRDTDDTIRQAKAHNAVGKDQCGWGQE